MRYIVPTFIAVTAAVPAQAQDAAPFTGGYASVTLGYDFQPNDIDEKVYFDRNLDGDYSDTVRTAGGADAFSPGFCNGRYLGPSNVLGCTNDRDNIGYMARLGYDQQYGSLVVGIVTEAGRTEIKDYVTAFSTTPASYVFERGVDYIASVRARVGAAADTTLFYGTFGPTYANLRNRFRTTNTANAFAARGGKDSWGFSAGGGVEQRIGRNFTMGLEYLYTQLNHDDYVVRVSQGTAPATNPFVLAPNTVGTDLLRSDPKFAWHSIRVATGYRF